MNTLVDMCYRVRIESSKREINTVMGYYSGVDDYKSMSSRFGSSTTEWAGSSIQSSKNESVVHVAMKG